jgi:hypothetical protein
MIIYCPDEIKNVFNLTWGPRIFKKYLITSSFEEYVSSTELLKIFWCSYDWNHNLTLKIKKNLNLFSKVSTYVFIQSPELHAWHYLLTRKNFSNVYWLASGTLYTSNVDQTHIFPAHLNLSNVVHEYKNLLPHKLKELNFNVTKPKLFDALLGIKKPHRTFVFNFLKESNLLEKSIVSYSDFLDSNWAVEPGVVFPDKDKISSSDHCFYDNIEIRFSDVLPLSVYNQTYYTIVTETNYKNEIIMLTEKIAKPLLARRLFVVFSSQGYLKYLKSMGFKTFSTIIDESYDDIEDFDLRMQRAAEQLLVLSKLDPLVVEKQIKDIVDHNFNLLINTQWEEISDQQIKNLIKI